MIAALAEQRRVRGIGERADFVKHRRAALTIEALDFDQMFHRRRREEPEAERLSDGRQRTVEHRICTGNVYPRRATVERDPRPRLDEPRAAFRFGALQPSR